MDEPGTVSVGLAGGSRVAVRLGAETPDGRNVYTQLDGDPGVALVNEPWARVLRRLAAEPPLPYWYYRVDPALVRIFEIESMDGIATFLLGLPGGDGGSLDRVVRGGAASDLTAAQRDAVLSVAGGPPGFDMAVWPEGLTLENAGLQSPRAVIRVTYELALPLEDKRAVSAVFAVGGRRGRRRWSLRGNAGLAAAPHIRCGLGERSAVAGGAGVRRRRLRSVPARGKRGRHNDRRVSLDPPMPVSSIAAGGQGSLRSLLISMKRVWSAGSASSAKIAATGQTGSHAAQSMHSSGSM